jgi:hypothetical protein
MGDDEEELFLVEDILAFTGKGLREYAPSLG